MKQVLAGVVGGILLVFVGAILFLYSGIFPMGANNRPLAIERWTAHRLIHAWVKGSMPHTTNPFKLTDANLLAGGKIYMNNCEGCHGTLQGGENRFAEALNPPPPQFAKHNPSDDPDGHVFLVASDGIRMTGMPAMGKLLKPNEIWKVVLFVKNFKKIPASVQKQLKGASSAS